MDQRPDPDAADVRHVPDATDDRRVAPEQEAPTGPPRWVKVLGVVIVLLGLLLLALQVAGGGRHGPARHALSAAESPPPDVAADRAESEGQLAALQVRHG